MLSQNRVTAICDLEKMLGRLDKLFSEKVGGHFRAERHWSKDVVELRNVNGLKQLYSTELNGDRLGC